MKKSIAWIFAVMLVVVSIFILTPVSAASVQGLWAVGHVQNIGWQDSTDNTVGTTGKALRLEAIQMIDPVLTIRGHVQNIGWMPWTETGVVGTTGKSLRLEAIQVNGRFNKVWCQAHVEDIGWMPPVTDGAVCGTTGRSLRLEAVRLWTE